MNFKQFLEKFRAQTGLDFCDYSDQSISRRLDKISNETRLSFEEMLNLVMTDESFKSNLIEEITVNTTELFRDPVMWVGLYKTLYSKLPKTGAITFWHIGCSKGCEVYSNLIMMHRLGMLDRCRSIGTDLNPKILDVARKGEYPYRFNIYYKDNFNKVMMETGQKCKFEDYFDIDEGKDIMKVKPFLLEKPTFYRQNLVHDKAPFAYKVDVVFFRNVLIYFNESLQNRVMSSVYEKMYNGGALILGRQEALTYEMSTKFNKMGQYYQKK